MEKQKGHYNPPTLTRWHLNIKPVEWNPPYDIFEDDESYLVRVEIAGMKNDNFLIWMEKGRLIITGERPSTEIHNTRHSEILYGKFNVSVHLKNRVEEDHVEANYQNGFLNIYLPKM